MYIFAQTIYICSSKFPGCRMHVLKQRFISAIAITTTGHLMQVNMHVSCVHQASCCLGHLYGSWHSQPFASGQILGPARKHIDH